jgi:hypothetical protein
LDLPEPSNSISSANPGTAKYAIAVIKDGGLAGCDGSLGTIEGDARARTLESFNGCRGGFVLVPDFNAGVEGLYLVVRRDPVHAGNFAGSSAQGIVVTDHDTIFLSVQRNNIEWFAGGEAETFALSDRKVVNAIVMSEDGPIF